MTGPDQMTGTEGERTGTEGYRTGYNAVHRYKSKVIALYTATDTDTSGNSNRQQHQVKPQTSDRNTTTVS
jgi:hypothetical protein